MNLPASRCAALVLLLAVAPWMTPSSRAANLPQVEAEQAARRSFQRGEAHFRAGRFAEALAAYEAGYGASPLPGFLVNIAQCQRRLGDLRSARTTYQKFVMVAPDSPLGPEVRTLIQDLGRLIAAEDQSASRTSTPPPEASPATEPTLVEPAAPSVQGPPIAPTAPTAPAAPAPALDAKAEPALRAPTAIAPEPRTDPEAPVTTHRTRWWLWGTLAAAIVGGSAAVFVLRSPDMETLHEGTLGTLRR